MRDRVLWGLQWVFGIYFIFVGIMHFVLPDNLPDLMGWMYELSDTVHIFSGGAEILGGLGLILPGLTRIRPQLTALAAAGLAIVMVLAAIWHMGRGEVRSVVQDLVIAGLLVYLGYARWKVSPLPGRDVQPA